MWESETNTEDYFLEEVPTLSPVSDDVLSSPFYENSPQNAPDVAQLSVELYHRPRGAEGNWALVQQNDKLRVSSTGKKLRIRATCLDLLSSGLISKVNIQLIHGVPPRTSNEGFVIEAILVNENFINIELKLFVLAPNLQFRVEVPYSNTILVGHSIQFSANNSGSRKPTTTKENSNGQHPFTEEQHLTSTTSTPTREVKRKKPSSPTVAIEEVNDHVGDNVDDGGATVLFNSLQVNGVVKAKAFIQYSDLRLKMNIEDIMDAMTIISNLQGKRYEWKDGDNSAEGGKKVIGLIAQEVQKVLPEIVHKDPTTGILSVSYVEIIPVLIEAYKEWLSQYKRDHADIQSKFAEIQTTIDSLHTQLLKQEQANEKNVNNMLNNITGDTKKILHEADPKNNNNNSKEMMMKRRDVIPWGAIILGGIVVIVGIVMIAVGSASGEVNNHGINGNNGNNSNNGNNGIGNLNNPGKGKTPSNASSGNNGKNGNNGNETEEDASGTSIELVLGVVMVCIGLITIASACFMLYRRKRLTSVCTGVFHT